MKFAVSHSLKRAGAGVAIAAALISATGCGYIYTQPTTLQYAASDGVKADLNGVELRNIMMVSSGKGGDGRLLGTILNKSDHDITVTFAFPSGEKSVKVAKGQQVRLESNDSQVIVPKISQTPGETLANTQVSSNDQSTNLNIRRNPQGVLFLYAECGELACILAVLSCGNSQCQHACENPNAERIGNCRSHEYGDRCAYSS